jgi:phenylacetate-CoA ligase
MACECSEHNGLHVAEEAVYLEVANADKNGVGDLLITDLVNKGMPFIRYKIQDACRLISGQCECGRPLRRIDLSAGRLSDYLISPLDGSYISGSSLVHYFFAEGGQKERMQLLQDARDHIVVKLVGNVNDSNIDMAAIRQKINTIFKYTMNIDFVFVDDIPFLSSGKYQFVRREF